jgi:hypothetical protein
MKNKIFIISFVIVSLFLFTFSYVPSAIDYYFLEKNNIPNKYVPFGEPFVEQFEVEEEPEELSWFEKISILFTKLRGDGWFQKYQKH